MEKKMKYLLGILVVLFITSNAYAEYPTTFDILTKGKIIVTAGDFSPLTVVSTYQDELYIYTIRQEDSGIGSNITLCAGLLHIDTPIKPAEY